MTQPARGRRTWQQWAAFAAVLVVGFVIWATVHDKQDPARLGSPAVDAPASPFSAPSPSPAAELSAADAAKQHDKGWVMEEFRLHRDTAGGAQGTARLKNANGVTMSAGFTVTMLNGEVPLMTWRGTALSVTPQQTVTVDMLTPDAVPPNQNGNFRLAFQVDSSVPS